MGGERQKGGGGLPNLDWSLIVVVVVIMVGIGELFTVLNSLF
jgi:hypothetical protein